MMPELFVQLYYNSTPFKKALLQVWAKSKRARFHTDLLVIDGPRDGAHQSIQKWIFAPEKSRPWGIDLPAANTLCGCPAIQAGWKSRYQNNSGKYGEYFHCFTSRCGHSEIAVAVFTEGQKQVDIGGTHVVMHDFDVSKNRFPMNGHDYYKIRAAVSVSFSSRRLFY